MDDTNKRKKAPKKVRDDDLRPVAQSNGYENFLLEFHKKFVTTVLEIEQSNKALFDVLVQDPTVREQVTSYYAPQVFSALRETGGGPERQQ